MHVPRFATLAAIALAVLLGCAPADLSAVEMDGDADTGSGRLGVGDGLDFGRSLEFGAPAPDARPDQPDDAREDARPVAESLDQGSRPSVEDAWTPPTVTDPDAAPPPPPPEPDAAPPPPPPPAGCDCYYGDGLYCATGVRDEAGGRGCQVALAHERPDAVLRCSGGAWSVERDCAEGCVVAPPGQADACRAGPDDGQYRLPWTCGATYRCTQGTAGDICGGGTGSHTGRQNFAFDFGMPSGTEVRAARGGEVAFADNLVGPGQGCFDGCNDQACCNACLNSGNRVVVRHGDGTSALYLHLERATVAVGQPVSAGDLLGRSGTSGCAFGAHLHFQLQADCGIWFCDSRAVSFAEHGGMACGVQVPSQNCP